MRLFVANVVPEKSTTQFGKDTNGRWILAIGPAILAD